MNPKMVTDWAATAAWVQAVGAIAAIWAASRVAVLQQRLSREQVVQGVVAAIGVAHQVIEDAAATARDHGEKWGWPNFDAARFTDALTWLANLSPETIADLRLVEILSAYPPMLRDARNMAERCVSLASRGKEPGSGVWPVLHEHEQRSAKLYLESGKILGLAQRRRWRWWVW